MIFAVRLRPYNKKAGNKMKTYLSGHGRTKYTVGIGNQPSPIRVITDRKELHELREYPQFEIIPFDDRKELDRFINREVLVSARQGKPVVKPVISNGPQDPNAEPTKDDDDNDLTVDSIFEEISPGDSDELKQPSIEDALEEGEKNFTPKEPVAAKNTGRKPNTGTEKSNKATPKTGKKSGPKKKSASRKKS